MRAAGAVPAPRGEGVPARLLALVALALAMALLAYRALHDLELRGLPAGQASWALVDFAEQVYGPERSFLEGTNPYRGYPVPNSLAGYAPHTLLVHLPFGLAGYETAAVAYATTVVLLTIAIAWLALRWGGGRATLATTAGLGALLLVSRPGQMNAMNGNVTAQIVVGAYAALHWARRRPALAAAGLALALIKPTMGLPLAMLMLFGRGDRRAVVLGALGAGVLSAVVVAIILPAAGGVGGLVESLGHGVEAFRRAKETNPVSGWMRIDAPAVLGKVAGRALPVPVEIIVGAGILGAGVLGVRRFLAAGGSADAPVVTALVCLTILVFAYQQAYNALLLVQPAVALARDRRALGRRGGRLAVLGLLLFPFVNYASSYTVLERLGTSGWRYAALTSASGVALVVAWAIVLAAAVRPVRAGKP
ncbi:MAG TPA: glycosyltransferase 87 family protein [Candidatus Binatia bacterium]|nr:glycosyltransferase 87 family protein [Candidatus Binatia bacterium]